MMCSGKKIIGIGVTVVVLAATITVAGLLSSNDLQEEEPPQVIKADVIMPIKVSRPGCEDIDRCYVPPRIVVKQGENVTWVNEDSAFHSVTSGSYGEPTELFDSGYMEPFELFTFHFGETGTFDYFCTLHPWMKGQVVVE